MHDPHHPQDPELVEHKGYQSRLEWLAFLALPKQRPTLVLVLDREAALAKVYDWIDLQLTSGKQSE